jgi:hypothetical protein
MQIDIKYVIIGQLMEQNAGLSSQVEELKAALEEKTKEVADLKTAALEKA